MEHSEDQTPEGSELLRRLASTAIDLVPGVGQIKLVQEAIEGRTADGFELNWFERSMYLGSVLMTVTAVGAGAWAFHEKNMSDGALSSLPFVASWTCFGLGKARQFGFTVPDSVKSVVRKFVVEKDS